MRVCFILTISDETKNLKKASIHRRAIDNNSSTGNYLNYKRNSEKLLVTFLFEWTAKNEFPEEIFYVWNAP